MLKGRRFNRTKSFEQRLSDEAAKLRGQAKDIAPGMDRERLIRMARQAESASNVSQWLRPRGLQAPK
jgi:hypothetical protein